MPFYKALCVLEDAQDVVEKAPQALRKALYLFGEKC